MSGLDIVLILCIAAAFLAALVRCVRNRKRGGTCCGECAKCAGCASRRGGERRG